MTDVESQVLAAWREAAADLGIRFTSPFAMTGSDGRRYQYLGLVHRFGRRVGTIIAVLAQPSDKGLQGNEDYTTSILSDSYARYDRQLFIDTLDDWQFLGPDSEKPPWYTGKSWC